MQLVVAWFFFLLHVIFSYGITGILIMMLIHRYAADDMKLKEFVIGVWIWPVLVFAICASFCFELSRSPSSAVKADTLKPD
jgi:hypothetical protein